MNKNARWAVATGVFASMACVGPWSSGAGIEAGGPADAPDISARADRFLREMGEYLRSLREFTFHADVAYDSVLADGQKIQYGGVADVAVRRPDRLHVEYRGDERQSQIVFDGSVFSMLDLEKGLYAQTTIPGELDAAVDHIFDKYGFSVPIADFVYADPYQVLTENVATGVWVGRHAVDGTPCNHLAFTQESIDWQIWIEDGPRPWPRKLVITYKHEPSSPQYTARLTGWGFEPRVSESWFRFEPPIGASEMEFLPLPEGAIPTTETQE